MKMKELNPLENDINYRKKSHVSAKTTQIQDPLV